MRFRIVVKQECDSPRCQWFKLKQAGEFMWVRCFNSHYWQCLQTVGEKLATRWSFTFTVAPRRSIESTKAGEGELFGYYWKIIWKKMKWPRNSSKDEKADQLAIWLLRTFRCLWQQFTQNIL